MQIHHNVVQCHHNVVQYLYNVLGNVVQPHHNVVQPHHDVGQSCITWHIQPEVGCDDYWDFAGDGLQTTVYLPDNLKPLPLLLHLRGKCGLRPVQQRRQHLTCLVAVVVNGLRVNEGSGVEGRGAQ